MTYNTLSKNNFRKFSPAKLREIAAQERTLAIRDALRFMFSKSPSAKDTLDI